VTAAGDSLPPGTAGALLRVGHELAVRARRLGAERLYAELVSASGLLWLSCEGGAVRVTGEGFDVELSALPEWCATRPPGA
jgi:hypothetical protein